MLFFCIHARDLPFAARVCHSVCVRLVLYRSRERLEGHISGPTKVIEGVSASGIAGIFTVGVPSGIYFTKCLSYKCTIIMLYTIILNFQTSLYQVNI